MKRSYAVMLLVLAVGLGIGCQDKAAIAEFEELKSIETQEEQNKEIVKRWLDELDKGNFGIVDELIAEDCQAYYAGETYGREWLRASCEAFPSSFSGSAHIIEDLIAEGDKVVARLTVKATHTGDFMGVPPSGRYIEYRAFTVYRIGAGQVKEIWVDQNAVLELMLKLGIRPDPAEGASDIHETETGQNPW